MINLLGRDGRHALRALAGSESLLAFDFDGTLAPLVADRQRAALRPRTRALLAHACRLYPCAVISGRSRADVARRLAGTGIARIVGNHGLEGRERTDHPSAPVRRAHGVLREALHGVAGIDLEDKGMTLAVHYRHASARERARTRVLDLLEPLLPALRVVGGHYVVNVLPVGEEDKGTALLQLWGEVSADVALYVGDDLTDEHAFQVAERRPLVAARIGSSTRSGAGYVLRSQSDIDELLALLVAMRCGAPQAQGITVAHRRA